MSSPGLLVTSHTSQQGVGEACCPELPTGTDKKLQVKPPVPPGQRTRKTGWLNNRKLCWQYSFCSSQTSMEKLHPSTTSFTPWLLQGLLKTDLQSPPPNHGLRKQGGVRWTQQGASFSPLRQQSQVALWFHPQVVSVESRNWGFTTAGQHWDSVRQVKQS